MKILKNKFTLSLGTAVAVIAPVASVVACGESSVNDISDSEKNQRETLSKSQQFIQTKYQEYLISEISKDANHGKFGKNINEDDLKSYAKLKLNTVLVDEMKGFIKRNIYTSSTYLKTFADKLLHTIDPATPNQYFKQSKLRDAGFYNLFLNKTDVDAVGAKVDIDKLLVDDYMEVIWDNNITNFKNAFYQYVISNYYLSTTKDNWSKVFVEPVGSTERLSDGEDKLEDKQFVLALKTMRAKLAFDWTVSLDDIVSKTYAGVTMSEKDIDEELQSNTNITSIYKNTTKTTQNSLIPGFVWDKNSQSTTDIWSFVKINKDIIGFNGIVSKTGFGSIDDTVFNGENDASKNYDEKFVGYVNPENTSDGAEKIVKDPNKQIKLTTPANPKVSLEKIIMILPRNINGKLSIESLKSSDQNAPYNILKQIIIANDSSIYNEAITYYSSKDNQEFNWDAATKTGGIRLKFTPQAYELEKLAIDTFKFPFIEKNEDK